MNSMESLTSFFGWCSVINVSLLLFTTVFLLIAQKPIAGIHARMFGLEESALTLEYFRYIARFKILIIVFNIVPYFALTLMP